MYHHSVTRFIHNSVPVCECVCACASETESMMCQGQETYGGRRSAAVSREEPGHVSTVMDYIFLYLDFSLFPVCVCLCVCECVKAEERPILEMISVALWLMFPSARKWHPLPAWLSVHCHVLHWDVNQSVCMHSACTLALTEAFFPFF